MGHSYGCNFQHCIFSTRERRGLLRPDMQDCLWPYFGGIARDKGMTLLAAGGTENHVHVLLLIPPAIAIAKAMQ